MTDQPDRPDQPDQPDDGEHPDEARAVPTAGVEDVRENKDKQE